MKYVLLIHSGDVVRGRFNRVAYDRVPSLGEFSDPR